MKRYLFLICISLLCIIGLHTVHANEATGTMGSVTVKPTYEGEAVLGGNLYVYQVALKSDTPDGQHFVMQDGFKAANIDLNGADLASNYQQYAQTLAQYTNQVTPYFEIAELKEAVTITQLPEGIYLFVQTQAAKGYEVMAPFLVTIPYNGNYQIDAFEKMSPKKAKNEKGKVVVPNKQPNNHDKELPKTGHVWWPVYVLAGVGLILILISFIGVKRYD